MESILRIRKKIRGAIDALESGKQLMAEGILRGLIDKITEPKPPGPEDVEAAMVINRAKFAILRDDRYMVVFAPLDGFIPTEESYVLETEDDGTLTGVYAIVRLTRALIAPGNDMLALCLSLCHVGYNEALDPNPIPF